MSIPFTTEQFLDVFAHYNITLFPAQVILNLLALLIIILTIKKIFTKSEKIIAALLAFLWIWIGLVYHMLFFSTINKAAYLFAVLFIMQGLLFYISGVRKEKLFFLFKTDLYGWSGALFILYALIIYPILGHNLGHVYPWSPTFGLPCPTTIFTFGVLLMSEKKLPNSLLIIPIIWSLIGFSAAVNLHIYEDFGLVIAGIAATVLVFKKNRVFTTGSTEDNKL